MKKFNKITPEGTKDILFEECLSQRTVSERLTHIFKMRGYNEVITPGMEYYDVFDAPNAAIPQYEMYKSTDNKGRLIVFRPDLTLPIARLPQRGCRRWKSPFGFTITSRSIATARTFPAAATKQRRRASSFWVHRAESGYRGYRRRC